MSKKSKMKIMDDDDYSDAIQEIIEREYFPYHQTIVDQNKLLDRLSAKGIALNKEALDKMLRTPSAPKTPLETPFKSKETPSENITEPSKLASPEKVSSLQEFVSSTASMDELSFQKRIAEDRERHRRKYWWLDEIPKIEAKPIDYTVTKLIRSNGKTIAIKNSDHTKTPEIDKEVEDEESHLSEENAKKTLTLLKNSKGDFSIDLSKKQRTSDIKSKVINSVVAVDSNENRQILKKSAKNHLMFFPQQSFEHKEETGPKPSSEPGNTRFKVQIKCAKKKEKPKSMYRGSIFSGVTPGESTPSVAGYRIVDSSPNIDPNGVGASPIVTWGDAEGTPLHLSDEDSDEDLRPAKEKVFAICETPRKEKVHYALEKRMKRKRGLAKRWAASPQGLTPAGRYLMARSRSHTPIDMDLRRSYGSTPIGRKQFMRRK